MSDPGLADLLARRFADAPAVPEALEENPFLARLAGRGSCRRFLPDRLPREELEALVAVALGAPSKSDLQQRDILIVEDADTEARLKALLSAQGWIAGAPHLMVVLANNRRQRQLHEVRQRDFANDHLDALFNATVDAAIALGFLVVAIEAAGLGCCPISTIRNHPREVAALLALPDHVFPVAALAVGRPAPAARRISRRLPLALTLHRDRYSEPGNLAGVIRDYDLARAAEDPAPKRQRRPEVFGLADPYLWSDDKTRQYSAPERADFGAYLRSIGFTLD